MKRICFCVGDISRSGGTERVTLDVARLLMEHGQYAVHILSLEERAPEPFYALPEGVTCARILEKPVSFRGLKLFYYLRGIRRYVKQAKIDVVVDVDSIMQLFSIPATAFTPTRVVCWEQFNYYENLGTPLRDWGRKVASRYADAIITLTNEDRGYFERHLKLRCPVYTIYNPIAHHVARTAYNRESKQIISAGRLTYQKGFDMLVEVAKRVLDQYPDWQWVILGEGPDRVMLEEKIRQYGMEGHIILAGRVADMASYYQDAALFVLTSRYEGFGLVLTEAKAYHLPCVSFRCKAGPQEIVLDGENGYLIDCFDLEQMAERIMTLLGDDERRARFAAGALKDTEKFGLESLYKRWEEVLG